MGKKQKTKSQVKSSDRSGMASNQPERSLPQSKNRSMSPESGTFGEIIHDSDKLRGTKLDTDHIPSNGTMDAVDNLTKTFDKGVKVGEKRGIDQEKDRAKGQEEMKVGRSYADILSKQSQKNKGSGKNNLQPSKKIKILNSPVYKGKISRSLVGSIYQVKLLILLLKNALDKNDDSFYLGTEVQKAKDFDDLVFQYKKNNKSVSCFLQAKHLVSRNRILFDDLVNEEEKHGAFYLKKYFDSYREIIKLKEGLHQPLTNPNREFVIYTNINFDQLGKDLEDSFQELKDKDSILNLVVKKGSQHLKFKDDFSKKAELVSALKQKDNSVTDQEIEDFFKHLVFAVNQPDEEELEGIIERKLGKQFNLYNASFVFSRLLNEGINIAKEEKKERTFLSNQCIKELFEKMKQEVATLVAIGPTALSRIKMRDLGLTYNQEAIGDLQNFLENKRCKILNLLAENIRLSAAKVNQVLDNNSYDKEDSCTFVNLEDLLTLQHLVEAFKLKGKERLLVVMCEPVKEDVKKLFDELYATIQSCNKKRIIFITEQGEDNSLFSKIEEKFSWERDGNGGNNYKQIEDKNSNFKHLDSKSQENLKERPVTFQGHITKLGLLATSIFLDEFISGKVLIDLVQGKEIKIGSALPISDHIDIERTFKSQVILKENALNDQNNSDIFVISKATAKYLKKFSNDNKVKELNKDNPESHFKRICEENKERNVHWLNREKDAKGKLVLVHKKSQGSLCNLRQYINLNIGKDENKEEFIERRLAILAGEPGIGKSSTMERLLRQIRESNPLLWVVKINLVNCRSQLSKVNFDHSNLEGVADFLSENVQLNTKLEKELFKYKLWKKNEIALLFDGFDEIGSVYEEKILLLLKVLKDLPSIDKMYISTRPYMKGQLEDSLGVFSCELSPLKPQDQKKFLQYLFKKEISENSNVNEERISTFVVKLLESCSKILNEAFSLSNPLHLKMLVNFFEKDFQEFYDNGNECSIKFDNFNFLDLYEYYLARKICIHIDKNSTIFKVKFAELLNKSDFLHRKNLCKEKRDALEALSSYKNKFAAIFLEILFREEKYSNQLKLDQEHKDDLHNIGTLHQCLYEYYVAKFFVDKCLEDPNNRDLGIFELLKEYYFHPDGKGMRHFFDLIVSRDYSLHMDVINGDFSKVETLIRSKNKDEETKLLKLDPQDKSILHLVREGDYKKFADAVKEEAKNAKKSFTEGILRELIERKDKVFGYTALEYAVRSGSWKIVDKFLELKGWFKKDGYVSSVQQDRVLPTTSLDILQADSFIKSGLTLHKAIKIGYFYIALWMISMPELDGKLEEEDSDGRNPLYYIIYKNKISHSPLHMLNLIRDRVNFNKPDRFGQTAAHFLMLAIDKAKKDILPKDCSISLMSDIFGIVRKNKVDMNVCDKSGSAPIHLVSDRLVIIQHLIEKGGFSIDLNLPRKDKKTLLHLAAIRGDVEMIQYLALKDASLNEKDSDGNTPLHLAVREYGQRVENDHSNVFLEIIKFLVEKGADFEIKNSRGYTPKDGASGSVLEYLNSLPSYEQHLEEKKVCFSRELEKQLLDLKKEGEKLYKLLKELKEQIEKMQKIIEEQNQYIKTRNIKEAIELGLVETECLEEIKREQALSSREQGRKELELSEPVEKISSLYREHNAVLENVLLKTKSIEKKEIGKQTESSSLSNIIKKSINDYSALQLIQQKEFLYIGEIKTNQEEYQAGRKKQKMEESPDDRKKSDHLLQNTEDKIKGLFKVLEQEIDTRLVDLEKIRSASFFNKGFYCNMPLPHQQQYPISGSAENYSHLQCFNQQGTLAPLQHTSFMLPFSISYPQQRNSEHASNSTSAYNPPYIRNQDLQHHHIYFDQQNPSHSSQPGISRGFQPAFLPNQYQQYFLQYTPTVALPSLQQSNFIPRKRKAEKISSSKQEGGSSKRHKGFTEIHSVFSDEQSQEVFKHIFKVISSSFLNASIKSVRQGLYLPSFEKREVKINGKCIAITWGLSQALLLQSGKSFLNSLEASSRVYERMAQHMQVSKREEREVFELSKLFDSFERKLDSSTSSLPLNLTHAKGYKTLGDLSIYIAGVKGDFAIHLVTREHVIAIYRAGKNYAYFDSNAAFVSGLKNVDQLMEVVEKAIKIAGYKVEEKGFLVEHFNVEQANKLLSNEDKEVLTKEIKTERQLLAEQDKEFGLIKINGQELSRVQSYDFGAKIKVEGSIPLLINADMNLSSKKFQDHLDKKEMSITAREYLDNLKNSSICSG